MLDNPAVLGVIYSTIFTRAVKCRPRWPDVDRAAELPHQRARPPSVVPSEVLGGYAATMHLIEAGPQRASASSTAKRWMEAAAANA